MTRRQHGADRRGMPTREPPPGPFTGEPSERARPASPSGHTARMSQPAPSPLRACSRRDVRALLGWVLTGLLLAAMGCDQRPGEPPDEPPEPPAAPPDEPPPGAGSPMPYGDLDTQFPESIGPYRAGGAVVHNHALVNDIHIPSARRQYVDGERELIIEVFDARMAPVLAGGFQAARQLESDTLDELVRSETVAGYDALLTWTRAEAESSVQVLLPAMVLIQLKVWPADSREQALQLLAAVDLSGLGRRLSR